MKRFQYITPYIISSVAIIPLIMIYEEIAFFALSLRTVNMMGILTSALVGLLLFFVSNFIAKYNKWLAFVLVFIILSLLSILYITESYIYKVFNTFMPLDMIISNAMNVVKNYGSDTASAVFSNIFIIIIFILPLVVLALYRKKLFIDVENKISFLMILSIIILLIINNITSNNRISNGSDFYSVLYKNGLINAFINKDDNVDTGFNIENEKEEQKDIRENAPDDEIIAYNIIDFDFEKINKEANDNVVTYNNEYVESLMPSKKNNYTGIFKGKNIIMMCAESFSPYAVSEELTPTLYRLIHNGFYFSNAYMTTITNSTTEGEFQLITGLGTGYGNVCMEKTIGKNNYCTFGNFSKRAGYNTACFHNGNYYYYNRNVTHESIGYDIFLANNKGLYRLTNNDGSDYAMFDKTLDLYMDKTPFSVYYMTYDGHIPYNKLCKSYTMYSDMVKEYYGSDIEEDLCSYICKEMSFDRALENMIKKLDEKGILNDTVIVFAADHYPYGLAKNGSKSLYTLYGKTFEDRDIDVRDSNGIVIWSGALENDLKPYQKEIKDPVNSLDILPTLLNLFGFEYDSRLFVGRDVFSDTEPIIFWGNESFLTNKCFYNSIDGNTKSIDGSDIDNDYIQKNLSIVKNKLKYSKYVLSTDYFKYLFGKEDVAIANNSFRAIDSIYSSVTFGNYHGEDLEWSVLEKRIDGRALLLSKNIVDVVPYGGTSWENSYLRRFANSTFLNEAFSIIDQSRFFAHETTEDTVFVFSHEDFVKYFGESIDEMPDNALLGVGPTKYAIEKGLYRKSKPGEWYDGNGSYWLRDSNSIENMYSSTIEYNGYINSYGYTMDSPYIGFRPAIWVLLD